MLVETLGKSPPAFAGESPVLIDVSAVAAMASLSTRTIWRLVSAGKIVAPLKISGARRWRKADILEWIRAGCPAGGKGVRV